ncbi:hypothetical protein B0H66DRAFT_633413 [Apodospora peruviana]|uniref:Uncharacterized protein n=1 Tax=Apodospora peruviana TaxID=516989 RepID=A0AAE0LYM9_9PEZI|nr:hypothetical protein B0H66DRAFT_633413 [Apodospora peruviana]
MTSFAPTSIKGALPDSTTHSTDSASGELPAASSRDSTKNHDPFWLSFWKWELAALFLACGLLVAIGIILAVYTGQPTPRWPLGVNINSLVAILTTMLRALLMVFVAEVISQLKWGWFNQPQRLRDLHRYDSASRGVWGSVLIIFRKSKLNTNMVLTMLCAVVTIISLGIGPMAQQAINSTTCSFIVDGVHPTVQIARTVDAGYIQTTSIDPSPEEAFDLNPGLKAKILNALMDKGNATAPTTCPTGNCTFADPILRTSSLKSNPTAGQSGRNSTMPSWTIPTDDWSEELGLLNSETTSFSIFDRGVLNITTFNGVPKLIMISSPDIPRQYKSSSDFFALVPAHEGLICPGNESSAKRFQHDPSKNTSQYTIVAAQCWLYPCVRRYEANMRNTLLQENTTSTTCQYGNVAVSKYQQIRLKERSPRTFLPITPCTLDGLTFDLHNMSLVAESAHRTFVNATVGEDTFLVPGECAVRPSEKLQWGLEAFLQESLDGDGTQPSRINTVTSNQNPDNGVSFTETLSELPWRLRNSYGITLETTEFIRNNPGYDQYLVPEEARGTTLAPSPHFVTGVMTTTTVCVLVDWRWLSFHAALLVLAVVPFAVMAVQQALLSRREGRLPQWKSSLLPLLFHGLGNNFPQSDKSVFADGKPLQPREMEDIAKNTIVRFRSFDDGGFKLAVVNIEADVEESLLGAGHDVAV